MSTGWAIALDNIWENEALGWKFKELNYNSESCSQTNLNDPDNDGNKKILKQKHFQKDNQLLVNQLNPSKRMIHYLLNNIRLSASCLEKFLTISAEHIPSLNLTEDYITLYVNQR